MPDYVSIKDIAKKLEISHSTVSRALKDNPRISQATRDLIKKTAEEMGYSAHSKFHDLLKGKTGLIGIIVPDISVNFFSELIKHMISTLDADNYTAVLFNTNESMEQEIMAIDKCLSYRVEGVIAAISNQTEKFNHFEKLLEKQVPLVFYDRVANFLHAPKIVLDDYAGSHSATKHLIDQNCKEIVHISGSANLNNSNKRLYGYLDALEEASLHSNDSMVYYYTDTNSLAQYLKKIFKKYPKIDGISTFNDYLGYNVVNILSDMGKEVPRDVKVIGFSDEPIATVMEPRLSSVRQMGPKMGVIAVKKLIKVIRKEEEMSNEKIVLKPKIIVRGTTKHAKMS